MGFTEDVVEGIKQKYDLNSDVSSISEEMIQTTNVLALGKGNKKRTRFEYVSCDEVPMAIRDKLGKKVQSSRYQDTKALNTLERELTHSKKNKGQSKYDSSSDRAGLKEKDWGVVTFMPDINKRRTKDGFKQMMDGLDRLNGSKLTEYFMNIRFSVDDMRHILFMHEYYNNHRPKKSLVTELNTEMRYRVGQIEGQITKRARQEGVDFMVEIRDLLSKEIRPYNEGTTMIRKVAHNKDKKKGVEVNGEVEWFNNTKGVFWSMKEH
jgi:hypothetical protein